MEETYDWPLDNTGMFTDMFNLSGRICRLEFIIYTLGGMVVFAIAQFIPYIQLIYPILAWIWTIGLLAESVKRLHDFDATGKWVIPMGLLHLVSVFIQNVSPVLELIILIIMFAIYLMLAICPGTDGINRYGTNPTRSYREQTVEAGYPDLDADDGE